MQQPDSIAQELLKDREKGSVRFMAEYRERLYSVALALCHDETEAEDLVLRTLERIIEKIGDYQERNSFYNWACVIMLNLYRDSTRGKVVQGTVPVGGAAEMDALMEPVGAERIVMDVDSGVVRQVLERMPEDMREVLLLHYFMDMPIGKIAKFLAMPVGTIKSRLYYARVALAMRLGAKLKKPAVALIAAALLLLGATAAVVIGASNARGERQTTPKTFESCGLTTTDDASSQAVKDSDVLEARTSSAQPLCVATSRPFNLVTVRMQSDDETFQENVGLGQSGLSMPVSRSAVFPSAPERLGDDRSGAALTALDTRVHIVRLGWLEPLDTVVHYRKSGPNMNLNCTKRSFTIIFR